MASVLSAQGFRFLFRTDEGRIGRQVWWLGTILLVSIVIVFALGWLALSPYAHRTLDVRKFYDPMTFVSYAYLIVYAFAVLLIAVCYVNLSAKRLRDGGIQPGLAGAAPLAIFLALAAHWLQPRVAEVFPTLLLVAIDLAALGVVLWQVYLLGVRASEAP